MVVVHNVQAMVNILQVTSLVKEMQAALIKLFQHYGEKQEDDNYKYIGLPNPETDFLGGKTQFISPEQSLLMEKLLLVL